MSDTAPNHDKVTAQLRASATRLAQGLRSVREVSRHLEALIKLLQRQPAAPREVERVLRRARQGLERVREQWSHDLYTELEAGFHAVEDALPELRVRWKMDWLGRLETALRSVDLEVRPDGEALRVDVLRLEPQWSQGKVQVFFGPDRLDTLPSEPVKIARWLKQWRQQLGRTLTEPDLFVDQLWHAYRAVTRRQGTSRALLGEVYRELVWMKQPRSFWVDARPANFRPYPRYAFSLDLARLRATPDAWQDRFEIRLLTATFDATRDRAAYLWIPEGGPHRGARYSWIEMKPRVAVK